MPQQGSNFEDIIEALDAPSSTESSSLSAESDGLPDVDGILPGFAADTVPFLAAARQLDLIYPLLHALTRGSLNEFVARVSRWAQSTQPRPVVRDSLLVHR